MQNVDGHIILSPSDLNDYVECSHLTTLALEVARGERARLYVADEEAELLRRKGAEHERAHLERLQAEGRTIVEIGLGELWDFETAAYRTAEAMRAGTDVVSQATFVDGLAREHDVHLHSRRWDVGEKNSDSGWEYASRVCASAATPADDGGLLQAQGNWIVLRLAFSISSAALLGLLALTAGQYQKPSRRFFTGKTPCSIRRRKARRSVTCS